MISLTPNRTPDKKGDKKLNEKVKLLTDNIEKVIVGKTDSVLKIITAMLCGGHVLIEDVPGVGKTQLVSALARSVDGKYNRIQLTPDVMPSDIVGFSMIDQKTHELEYKEGVAMCNFLLADEINRASQNLSQACLKSWKNIRYPLTVKLMNFRHHLWCLPHKTLWKLTAPIICLKPKWIDFL